MNSFEYPKAIPATMRFANGEIVQGRFINSRDSNSYFVPPRKDGESDEDWQARWECIKALEIA